MSTKSRLSNHFATQQHFPQGFKLPKGFTTPVAGDKPSGCRGGHGLSGWGENTPKKMVKNWEKELCIFSDRESYIWYCTKSVFWASFKCVSDRFNMGQIPNHLDVEVWEPLWWDLWNLCIKHRQQCAIVGSCQEWWLRRDSAKNWSTGRTECMGLLPSSLRWKESYSLLLTR